MSSARLLPDLPPPVKVADERVGLNGAIAAALTRWIGSMPALYAVLVIVGGWMALATWGPLHRADPFPFPFLLFLDNVIQLVLCLVILVGQRVLGVAADRRAVQTYDNAEAIFARIADLQAHLDIHDQALSRGASLLESSPHPWIERHRVQQPPQAMDHVISRNGRIAAWLTQRLGSVWAFYLAAGTQVIWIGLAAIGLQRFDPYPFAFMTFLSTLVQLLFMIVIMVGQDVLGHAADRRSEQTFLNAEAILHECRRMKARLTAQDRLIDSLTGYATTQITERLAQALHEASGPTGPQPLWRELPEQDKETARAQAWRIGENLAAIGCLMVPAHDTAPEIVFTDHEIEGLARHEHERRLAELAAAELAPWAHLSDPARTRAQDAVRRLPAILTGVGYQVLRDITPGRDGPRETDFTPAQWDTLHQAMMAAGVLVGLAEGVMDPEEMFALVNTLREASLTHPSRFIRELTGAATFRTGIRADTTHAGYERPALAVIRAATAIIADTAPTALEDFRALLAGIAAAVADANQEGGFFGLGAIRRTPKEAAAMAAVRAAAGLSDP